LAVRARLTGITATDEDGFPASILHRVGRMTIEAGAAAGAGVGASLACLPGLAIVLVLYNVYAHLEPAMIILTPLALAAEAMLAAAWAGVAFKLAGRVPAIAVPVGAFVLARVALPAPVRALLPAPLSTNVRDALVHASVALLAALGLALMASSLARGNGERA
jgi:hypothetical protein